jgi:hypothetical protein
VEYVTVISINRSLNVGGTILQFSLTVYTFFLRGAMVEHLKLWDTWCKPLNKVNLIRCAAADLTPQFLR